MRISLDIISYCTQSTFYFQNNKITIFLTMKIALKRSYLDDMDKTILQA